MGTNIRKWTDLARVSQAALKSTSSIVSRHVPLAAHNIINVLAESRSVWTVLATTEAELAIGHEIGPLMELVQSTKSAREDQSTDRVP